MRLYKAKAITLVPLIIPLASMAFPIYQQKMMLESTVLKLVDGSFFNADRIEDIRALQFHITNLLRGERTADGTRVGMYTLGDKKYNIRELLELEEQLLEQTGGNKLKTPEVLRELLEKAKHDFITISNVHQGQAQIGKSFTAVLMEESCKKRNRLDCLLLIWARAKTRKEEDEIFEKQVHTFKSFIIFLEDLFNFLTDLMNSCPKACELFRHRVEKFKAVKILLPKALEKTNISLNQLAFFKNIKEKHLDSLVLEKINLETVRNLIMTCVTKEKITEDESN
jgi:hypothetical protein